MNWIVANLEAAIDFFRAWMGSLYEVLMVDPISYQDGALWETVGTIYDGLLGPAISIMVSLFYLGVISDVMEYIRTRHFGALAVTFLLLCLNVSFLLGGKYLLLLIFWTGRELMDGICGTNGADFLNLSWCEIPDAVVWATNNISLTKGIVFWVVTLIFALVVMVCGFTILMVVYGRLFNICLHIAVAPVAIACMAGKPARSTFYAYIRSFIGVCLQGVVIVGVCLIFSAFANGFDAVTYNTEGMPPDIIVDAGVNGTEINAENLTEEEKKQVLTWIFENFEDENIFGINTDENAANAAIIWKYLSQMIFLYLIMASMIKGADSWVHQKLNL